MIRPTALVLATAALVAQASPGHAVDLTGLKVSGKSLVLDFKNDRFVLTLECDIQGDMSKVKRRFSGTSESKYVTFSNHGFTLRYEVRRLALGTKQLDLTWIIGRQIVRDLACDGHDCQLEINSTRSTDSYPLLFKDWTHVLRRGMNDYRQTVGKVKVYVADYKVSDLPKPYQTFITVHGG